MAASHGTNIAVPAAVTQKLNYIQSLLWSKDCPFLSLYLWIVLIIGLYYAFWLPEMSLEVDMGNNVIKPRKITQTVRGFLVLGTIVSGAVGYIVIKQGCQTAGPAWSFLWFLVALALTGLVTSIVLLGTEKYTLPQAASLLSAINKLNK
jgi:hypothetical protein